MARLQWQPIAYVDPSESAIRAQAQAGNAIQGAFSGLTGLLNQWEGDRREDNLAELYARQNRFAAGNDVDGYRADLADGDLMRGLNYLKASDYAAARGYTNELRSSRNADTEFERSGIRWDRDTKTYERTEADRTRANAIATQLAPIRAAAMQSGDRTAYNAATAQILKDNPDITAQQIDGLFAGGDAAVQSFRGDTNFANSQTRWGWDKDDREITVQEREDRKAVQRQWEVISNQGGTWEDLITSDWYQKDATVDQKVLARSLFGSNADVGSAPSSGLFGGAAAPVNGSFAGDATNALDVLNYSARNNGHKSIPSSIATYGDLDRYGTQILGTKGVTSTASGPYQITRDTRREFGERVLGPNWQSLPRSLENEDKIARAIFEQAKRLGPAAISGRWAAIDSREARQLAQMDWSQARGIIAAQEGGAQVGADPKQVAGQATDIGVANALISGTDPAQVFARDIYEGLNDQTPVARVVDRAIGEGGVFEGMSRRDVGGYIGRVQTMYANIKDENGKKINEGKTLSGAGALAVLSSAIKPHQNSLNNVIPGVIGQRTGIVRGGGNRFTRGATDAIHWDEVSNALGMTVTDKNGNLPLAGAVREAEQRDATAAGVQQGRAAVQAAQQNYQASLQADLRNPSRLNANGVNPTTERLRRSYEEVSALWGSFAGDATQVLDQSFGGQAPVARPVSTGVDLSQLRQSVPSSQQRPRQSLYTPR